ncbi:MAG: hypothetical protein ABEJ46_00490, partial [Gemmatimonadota bacterium]
MERSDPSSLRRQTTRRDEAGTSATFQLHLDPERDRRTAKVFGVTAAGARVDFRLSGDRKRHRDPTYDPVWESEATVDSAGWTAEARIPFGELRLHLGQPLGDLPPPRRTEPLNHLTKHRVL